MKIRFENKITDNGYLWIYCSIDNTIKKYHNVLISTSVISPIDRAMAFFDDGRSRWVSNIEFDVWAHAGYYLVWSTEDNDRKAYDTLYDFVNNDINDKIHQLEKQIKRYALKNMNAYLKLKFY